MAKKERPSAREGSHLLVVGAVLFVVAWFVPVVAGEGMFNGLATDPYWQQQFPNQTDVSAPDWLPGLTACKVAWSMLTHESLGSTDWRSRVMGATCLTNAVMLVSLLLLAVGSPRRPVDLLLLGCAALDASWLYLTDSRSIESYRAGYYLWLASFALVGAGALPGRGAKR